MQLEALSGPARKKDATLVSEAPPSLLARHRNIQFNATRFLFLRRPWLNEAAFRYPARPVINIDDPRIWSTRKADWISIEIGNQVQGAEVWDTFEQDAKVRKHLGRIEWIGFSVSPFPPSYSSIPRPLLTCTAQFRKKLQAQKGYINDLTRRLLPSLWSQYAEIFKLKPSERRTNPVAIRMRGAKGNHHPPCYFANGRDNAWSDFARVDPWPEVSISFITSYILLTLHADHATLPLRQQHNREAE